MGFQPAMLFILGGKHDCDYRVQNDRDPPAQARSSNARTHSKKQIEQIAASITANGFVNPILINPVGAVIAGHGRLRAAKHLRLTSVPTIVVSGLSEAEERRLRIADDKIALNAGWDADLLRLELAEIDLAGLDLELTASRSPSSMSYATSRSIMR